MGGVGQSGRDCTVYIPTPDAKEPGQRMASRVPFAPDRCPGRHGVLGGGHGLHCQCDGGAYPGQSVYRDGIDGYCRF